MSVERKRRYEPPPIVLGEAEDVIHVDVDVAAETLYLPGSLAMPSSATGIIVFAHGSGSSRLSPRNTMVAQRLNDAGMGTLLFDLLTPAESEERSNVFDVTLLAGRLQAAAAWLRSVTGAETAPIGFFGASTGAAAALVAAARMGTGVSAVVSRGGRPDLAGAALERVIAPTMLIVGGADVEVLELNRAAGGRLQCEKRLEIVRGATHLFEEPGALERVAGLAASWFAQHFSGAGSPRVSETA